MTDAALRMRVFAFVAVVLFGGLVARLWYLQGLDSQQEELALALDKHVPEVTFKRLSSLQGHDSFLVDMDRFRPAVASFF